METVNFELTGECIELKNLLKVMGVCESGGEAKLLISSGHVLVDGEVELRKARKIAAGQSVQTGNVKILVKAAC